MRRNQAQLQISAGRQAFTLVELLIVCTIIVILIALTLVVTNAAINSAKEAKTRATIQKLDVAMQQIFETYDEKFRSIQSKVAVEYPAPFFDEEERQRIAVHFIRDQMRMEMPQSWDEVGGTGYAQPLPFDPDKVIKTPQGRSFIINENKPTSVGEPGVFRYYFSLHETHVKGKVDTAKSPVRAALLFLIIQNLNPEALDAFRGSEIADTNGDGLLEFVDARGNPIHFLRWAPAFPGSDLQPNVLALVRDPKYNHNTDDESWWLARDVRLQKAMAEARHNYPDPITEGRDAIGWFLYPLIYSAGRDGHYDLTSKDPNVLRLGADGVLDPFAFPFGMPIDSSGTGALNHFDNIHNHRLNKNF